MFRIQGTAYCSGVYITTRFTHDIRAILKTCTPRRALAYTELVDFGSCARLTVTVPQERYPLGESLELSSTNDLPTSTLHERLTDGLLPNSYLCKLEAFAVWINSSALAPHLSTDNGRR